MKLPGTLDQITPDWLTGQLIEAESLGAGGRIEAISLKANPLWNVAETAFVTLEGTNLGRMPTHLFAKLTASADPLEHFMPGECAFYSSSLARKLPVPRCLLALRDEETGGSLLLLEDHRKTHKTIEWPYQPNFEECGLAVETLGTVHAATMLTDIDANKLSERERELGSLVVSLLPALFDKMGDALSRERRGLLEAALGQYSSFKEQRYRSGRFPCTSQGDSHVWNFLYPRYPSSDRCLLLDWEYWYEDYGATDLAFMMSLQWYPERRARFEQPLLRRYLDRLQEEGIVGFSYDDLIEDYRIAHICSAIVPIYLADLKKDVWWAHLERWFLAMDDLGARELL